jgi:hypothetical protein
VRKGPTRQEKVRTHQNQLHGSWVDEVLLTPLLVVLGGPIGFEDIEKGNMVSLVRDELLFGSLGLLSLVPRGKEDSVHREKGDHRNNVLRALQLLGVEQDLWEGWVKGQLRHSLAHVSELSFIAESPQGIQLLKTSDYWTRGRSWKEKEKKKETKKK